MVKIMVPQILRKLRNFEINYKITEIVDKKDKTLKKITELSKILKIVKNVKKKVQNSQ